MMSEATLLPLVSKPVTFSCSSRSGAGAVRSRSAAATSSAGACSACPALVARVAPDGTGLPTAWTGSSSGRRRTRVPLSLSRSTSSSSINNSNNRVVRHNTNDPAVSCNSVGYRNYTSSSRSSGRPVCRTNSTGSTSRVTATMGSSSRGSANSSHTPSNSDTCCRSTAASNRSSCAMRRNGARRSHTPVEVHSVMYGTDNTLWDMRQWPPRCSSLGPAAALHALGSSSTRSGRRRCRSEEAKQTQPCFCLTWKTVCTGERRGGRKSSLPARTTNAPSVPGLSLAPAAAPTERRVATYVPQAALATRSFSTVLPAAAVIPAAACLPLETTPASAAAAGRVLHVCEKRRQRLRSQQPVSCASGHHEEGAASAATASATSGGALAHPTCMYVPSGRGTEQPQRPKEEHSGSNRGQGGGQHSQDTAASPGWVPNSVWLSLLPHTKPQSAACGTSAGADGGAPPAATADASDGFVVASDTAADTVFLLEKSILDGPAASVNYGGRAAASLVDSGGPPPTAAASARCLLAPSRNGCTGAPVAGAVRRKQQDAGGTEDHVDGSVAANSISEGEQESVDSEAGEGRAETPGSGGGGAAATMWGRGRGDEGGGRASAAATHAAAGVRWRAAARRSAAEAAAGSVTAGAVAASGAARRPAVRSRLRRHPTDLSEGHIAWVGEEGRGGGVEAMDQARQGAPTTAAQEKKQPPVSWGTGTAMRSAESAAGSGIRSCASPEGNFFLRRPQTLRPQRQGRQLGQGSEGGETQELEEKEQGEEAEDGDEDTNDSKTSGKVSRGKRKDTEAAEKYWGLLGGLLERLRSSSRNSVRAALLLGEDFRKKLLQQKAQLESGKRLSGRCFFYLLLTFFLVLLALVLLLGTLQHQHKLYRLRPRQVLLLQQHTQRQLQQRMQQQQKQQQRNTHDSAWQQRFFEAVLRVPVPPLRPCAHGAPAAAGAAKPQNEWLHSSAAAAASACLLGEDACSREMPEVGTSSASRHQSCPKTEDAGLLPPAAPATAGDVPVDRRGALFSATRTRAFVPWKTSRRKPAGSTTFTGRKASAWRGIDTLGVCCVPLVLCPYSTAASDKRSHCKQPAASAEAATISRDFIRTHGSDHRFSTSHASRPPAAAAARATAFTSAGASAGDLSAATAAADVAFPRSVFFFSLRGHPPPLSFLDPASPVLVCAEADERQLLLRLLLQLVRPFRAASDAVRGLLQFFHPFVASSSTAQQQSPQQQPQQDQRQQHTLPQQQQHAEQREQSPVQQQQQTETEILQHTTQQERRSVSAAAQEGAAEAPCSGTLCCVAVPTGGVCGNISEEVAAAGETTTAPAEQGPAASEEPQTDSALAEWETQVVRVLAEGSAWCLYAAGDASSPSSCGLVREKLPLLQEQKRGPAAGAPGVPVAARDAAAVRSFLQEEKEATAPAVLSPLGEGEEPRLQVYAETLRASFNGLLPQYTQIRFAALSTEAAVLLYNFPGNAAGATPPDAAPTGAVVTSPASAVSSRLAVTQQTRGALLSLFWPVSTTPPVPGAFPASGVSSPAAALSSTGVPPAARSPPRCAAGAAAIAPSFPVSSVSSALLTRLSSLLPADISLYFSFSSYLSPCYPFSRFLHRRLVGWGGLQLHILLFGGWFHSLFAAEPLTLVHAPRAAFLFVLAAYRGLILYEAFSSLEAHYFRRAHTLQQQEHVRAAAAAAAVEEYDAGTHIGGGFAGRNVEKETGETELCADILFEREEDLRLLLQHRQAVQCAGGNARHESSCRDKSSSSSGRNSGGSGYPLDGEAGKKEQEEEGPQQQQQHGSERTKENETGGRRESCSRTRNTEDEGEFVVAAAAWTDFSDHVVLYVLVAIFAAMEIAAARSSHTRPRATPAAGSTTSTSSPAVCCSSNTEACSCCCSSASNCCSSSVNSSNSHHSSSNSSSNGNQLAGRCQDGASSDAGDASSVDSLFPSSALTTPASDQYYEKTLQQLAAGANGFNFAASGHQLQLTAGDAATAAKLGARVVAAGESTAAAAAYFSPSGTNNNSGTESTGRQAGTGKLYVVVWVYYGFLLLCCLHMAFYTACFFHTPQEIWSGLGVGLLFLVLPLVVACEILEKPTLQRLGIGSGERRAAKQGAGAGEAAHGGPAGGPNSSREPTGSSKRFAGPETAGIAMKEVEDEEEEEEEEEEMGFREDRLSSSSSLSVHSRSSSSSSNCSRLRERAAATGEARLFPAYRRRPHFFCSSSGSNSSHGGTSPLPAIPQRHLQQIAFHHLSRATRTRSNHGRRREESSSSHLHRGRNRSSSFMTPAAAAPSGRGMRKYCYDARDSLLQQHEDTVTIR